MTKKIEVLDALMGTGKTTAIINWMVANPHNKYLYVSPMLAEVEERIPFECAALEFVFPTTEHHKTKSLHLLELMIEGRNIAFTHSLFQDLSKLHLSRIEREGYILVIDEEVGLIERYNGVYKKGDITSLEAAKHLCVDEGSLGLVRWLWDDIEDETAYSKLKRLCDMEMLYCAKRSRDMMVIQLPMALVQSAYRTIVLTYLFEGSVMESFLKLRGVEIVPFDEVKLMKDPVLVKQQAKGLINLCTTKSIQALPKYSLSSTWYSLNATKEQLTALGKAIYSAYRKYDSQDVILTLPKTSTTKKVGNTAKNNSRYAIYRYVSVDEVFLYCSARATNDYAHKKVAIHAYNRYINTVVTAYLQDYGRDLNAIPSDDQFALAEMLQWLWRTQIRDDKPIDVYILSHRMLHLLSRWLEE